MAKPLQRSVIHPSRRAEESTLSPPIHAHLGRTFAKAPHPHIPPRSGKTTNLSHSPWDNAHRTLLRLEIVFPAPLAPQRIDSVRSKDEHTFGMTLPVNPPGSLAAPPYVLTTSNDLLH